MVVSRAVRRLHRRLFKAPRISCVVLLLSGQDKTDRDAFAAVSAAASVSGLRRRRGLLSRRGNAAAQVEVRGGGGVKSGDTAAAAAAAALADAAVAGRTLIGGRGASAVSQSTYTASSAVAYAAGTATATTAPPASSLLLMQSFQQQTLQSTGIPSSHSGVIVVSAEDAAVVQARQTSEEEQAAAKAAVALGLLREEESGADVPTEVEAAGGAQLQLQQTAGNLRSTIDQVQPMMDQVQYRSGYSFSDRGPLRRPRQNSLEDALVMTDRSTLGSDLALPPPRAINEYASRGRLGDALPAISAHGDRNHWQHKQHLQQGWQQRELHDHARATGSATPTQRHPPSFAAARAGEHEITGATARSHSSHADFDHAHSRRDNGALHNEDAAADSAGGTTAADAAGRAESSTRSTEGTVLPLHEHGRVSSDISLSSSYSESVSTAAGGAGSSASRDDEEAEEQISSTTLRPDTHTKLKLSGGGAGEVTSDAPAASHHNARQLSGKTASTVSSDESASAAPPSSLLLSRSHTHSRSRSHLLASVLVGAIPEGVGSIMDSPAWKTGAVPAASVPDVEGGSSSGGTDSAVWGADTAAAGSGDSAAAPSTQGQLQQQQPQQQPQQPRREASSGYDSSSSTSTSKFDSRALSPAAGPAASSLTATIVPSRESRAHPTIRGAVAALTAYTVVHGGAAATASSGTAARRIFHSATASVGNYCDVGTDFHEGAGHENEVEVGTRPSGGFSFWGETMYTQQQQQLAPGGEHSAAVTLLFGSPVYRGGTSSPSETLLRNEVGAQLQQQTKRQPVASTTTTLQKSARREQPLQSSTSTLNSSGAPVASSATAPTVPRMEEGNTSASAAVSVPPQFEAFVFDCVLQSNGNGSSGSGGIIPTAELCGRSGSATGSTQVEVQSPALVHARITASGPAARYVAQSVESQQECVLFLAQLL